MATKHSWVYSISSLYIFAGMIMAKATKSIQLIRHLNINNCASRRQPQRELKWEGNITLLREWSSGMWRYVSVILVSISTAMKTAEYNIERDIWVVDYWIGTV